MLSTVWLILGALSFAAIMAEAAETEIMPRTGPEFIAAKMAERDERHRQAKNPADAEAVARNDVDVALEQEARNAVGRGRVKERSALVRQLRRPHPVRAALGVGQRRDTNAGHVGHSLGYG